MKSWRRGRVISQKVPRFICLALVFSLHVSSATGIKDQVRVKGEVMRHSHMLGRIDVNYKWFQISAPKSSL